MGTVGDKRTPMAWQHRDMNYNQERYGGGPPSMSDRLSHKTDKSWRNHRDNGYHSGGSQQQPNGYPPSRPSYSSERPATRTHSSDSSSSTSSSTSEGVTDQEVPRDHVSPPQPMYGYGGYYPGYPPFPVGYPTSVSQGYPGTLKSTKSVPTIAMNTWDGEPCPVHGMGPMSLQGPPSMMGHPPTPMMLGPPVPMPPPQFPPRRTASIYDMRLLGPSVYGTLPVKPGCDRKSLPGAPPGIPHQLLPPLARPRPVVVSEDGMAEPLPVRAQDKSGALSLSRKLMSNGIPEKRKICSDDAICVSWIVIGVILTGLILGVLLIFIL